MNRLSGQLRRPANTVSQADYDQGRRGVLSRIVAASAAFATSFFVSSKAHAACNCNGSCQPQAGQCWSPQGLCYDDGLGQYLHVYDIYNGTPVGGCCAQVSSLACYHFCYTQALPC